MGMDFKVGREAKSKYSELVRYKSKFGATVLLDPMAEKEFRAKKERKDKFFRGRLGLKPGADLPGAESDESFERSMAETFVKGWEEVSNGDEPVPFTEDTFFEACRTYPGFAIELLTQVNAKHEELQEELKARSGK